FFADLVWHREDRDLGHGLVGLEGRLHLGGGDVLARAPDDVLLAVDEIEHAVFGPPHDVARVEPAAAPRLLGRLRVLEVAREESPSGVRAGAAHDEFARRPARDLAVTLVHHPRLELPPGRPKARVDVCRGSWQSPKIRPVSVMPHTSISGNPNRFSKTSWSWGSTPAPRPNLTRCRVSSGTRGWLSSSGGTTPR